MQFLIVDDRSTGAAGTSSSSTIICRLLIMLSIKAEMLIRLFLIAEAHMLVYKYRRKGNTYKSDKPFIDELMKDGLVKQVSKNNSEIVFEYIGEIEPPKRNLKNGQSKAVQSKKELIPLHTIRDGGYFRLPGKRKKFRKRDNLQTISFQDYLPDKTPVVNTKPGCTCVDSSGRTSVKDWNLMVEQAE